MLRDTDEDAQRRQDAVFRAMGPERRVAAAFDMSESAFAICRSGIQSRHPEYSTEQVESAELRLRLGDELFKAAYPQRPLLPA